MKIDSNKLPENQGTRGAQNTQKTQGSEAKDVKVPPLGSAARSDKVDISGRSRELADIAAAVDQLPDVREAKIREIKQSIEAGTYRVDPQKVAEKILKEL